MGLVDGIKYGDILKEINLTVNKIFDIQYKELQSIDDIPKLAQLRSSVFRFYDLIFNSGIDYTSILRTELLIKDFPDPDIKSTVEQQLKIIEDFSIELKWEHNIEISPIFKNDDLKRSRPLDSKYVRNAILENKEIEHGIGVYIKRITTESAGHALVEFIYRDMKIVAPVMKAYIKINSNVDYYAVNQKGTIKFFNPSFGQLIVSSLEV